MSGRTGYYNNDIKLDFLNYKLSKHTTYIDNFYRLFKITEDFEYIHNKDVFSFTGDDLILVFKNISPIVKYSTAVLYNNLINDYKRWAVKNELEGANLYTCDTKALKNIKTYKQYSIFNDDDIASITEHDIIIDGNDYLPVIFIRLFWEIDGQESVKDLLSLKTENFDMINKLTMNGHTYKLSGYLQSLINSYIYMDFVEYRNKEGRFPILTARENGGYIFRSIFRYGDIVKTAIGQPITTIRLSDIVHDFTRKSLTEIVTINDLLMSMALKHMVKYKKLHTEMANEKMYFSKVTSHTYKEVFNKYAKVKYPVEYNDYLNYINSLLEKSKK